MAPIPSLNVPATWSNHGDKNLICIPSQWTDVLLFCFANYLVHCATVKPYPAETPRELGVAMVLALFLPSSGIMRAMDSIIRRTNFRKMNELEKAAKAGALCMVIRTKDWVLKEGDVLRGIVKERRNNYSPPSQAGRRRSRSRVSGDSVVSESKPVYSWRVGLPPCMKEPSRTNQPNRTINYRHCKVNGAIGLPEGYSLAYVPSHAVVRPYDSSTNHPLSSKVPIEVSSSYNFLQAAIAIVQTCYASVTLYRTRGDQIKTYGYSSFGLTVTPYVLMSLLNLFGQIASSDYPMLHLVHSEVMDEARRRGGVFDGVVGTLKPDNQFSSEWTVEALPETPPKFPETRFNSAARHGQFILRSAKDERKGRKRELFVSKRDQGVDGEVHIPACSRFECQSQDPHHHLHPSRWRFHDIKRRWAPWSSLLNVVCPLLFGCVSIAIVGGISRFRTGEQSTLLQRAFTMSWLVVGVMFGPLARWMSRWLTEDMRSVWRVIWRVGGFLLLFGAALVPAIGGIVVVCQMIIAYGTCMRVS